MEDGTPSKKRKAGPGRKGSNMTKEQKAAAKNERQKRDTAEKKQVEVSQLQKSRVLFVVGGNSCCSRRCKQSERTIYSEDAKTEEAKTSLEKVKELAAWLVATPLHGYCLVELLTGNQLFRESRLGAGNLDDPIVDFNTDLCKTSMEQHVLTEKLKPLYSVVKEGGVNGVLPTLVADGEMSFDICHVNLLLGHIHSTIAGDEATVAFVKQSSFLSLSENKALFKFLAANFEVVFDGHDQGLYTLQDAMQESVTGSAEGDAVAKAAEGAVVGSAVAAEAAPLGNGDPVVDLNTDDREVWKYWDLWSAFGNNGCGMYPPPFQQFFYSDMVKRDRVFRESMLPFAFATLEEKPYHVGDKDIEFEKLTWLELGEHFWRKLHAANTDPNGLRYENPRAQIPCLNHDTFLQSKGLVIKPTGAYHVASVICFVKIDNSKKPAVVTAHGIQPGNILTSPKAYLDQFRSREVVVKVEPFNDEVKGHEYSVYYKFHEGVMKKVSIARSLYTDQGQFVRKEHVGLKKIENEPDYFERNDNGQVKLDEHGAKAICREVVTTRKLKRDLIIPRRVKEQVRNPNGRFNLYVEGMVYRFDFQNDYFMWGGKDDGGNIIDPPKWYLNSIKPVPSGVMLLHNISNEWYIAATLVESFHHFLKKNWANWPN